MTKILKLTLILFLLSTTMVMAEADGPDFFKVTGVAQNDTLNIHKEPRTKSKVIGEISPRGHCLKNLGCKGGITLNESMNLSEKEKAEISNKRPRWCKIAFDGVKGWVFARYVTESSCRQEIRP